MTDSQCVAIIAAIAREVYIADGDGDRHLTYTVERATGDALKYLDEAKRQCETPKMETKT